MSLDHPTLLMVPFRMLPSEMKPNCTAKDIDDERRYIRDVILARTRQELAADPHARALMQQLGSDLCPQLSLDSSNFPMWSAALIDLVSSVTFNPRYFNKDLSSVD